MAEPDGPLDREHTTLAGGALRVRLPRGAREDADADAGPGMLVPTTHTIPRGDERDVIIAADTGAIAGPDFGERVLAEERAMRCAGPDASVVAEPAPVVPAGFTAVMFRPDPDLGCADTGAPDIRVWIATPDRTVVRLELTCGSAPPCALTQSEVVAAMLASLVGGTPMAAPAGHRRLGPLLTVSVPEGYLVTRWDGADSTHYVIRTRNMLGEPSDALEISTYAVTSELTLAQDFARRGDRTRLVPGRFAGRSTRFLEIAREGRTRYVGRIDVELGQVVAAFGAADPAVLARLRAMVAALEVLSFE